MHVLFSRTSMIVTRARHTFTVRQRTRVERLKTRLRFRPIPALTRARVHRQSWNSVYFRPSMLDHEFLGGMWYAVCRAGK